VIFDPDKLVFTKGSIRYTGILPENGE
jgi:hypothetical protein